MAQVNKLSGTQLYVKIETAPASGTFTHPCLINAKRGLQFSSNAGKIIIPDCDNPEDPAWEEVLKDGLSCTITGAGKLDNVLATIQFYDAWFQSDNAKNVQAWLGAVGKWAGAFKLSQWSIEGERKQYVDVSLTLMSTGVVAAFAA